MTDLERRLQAEFGFSEFRPGQREVVESILSGRPTLTVMPTGSGKSLCYQLPAMILDGLTLVVSPLVALIRDQVRSLKARGIRAASLTSQDALEDRQLTLRDLEAGSLDLLYVAPERFNQSSFRRALQSVPMALFAVDEAHCISQWGHDFRPDYARLGQWIEELGPQRLVALTATATPDVREDICRGLGLRDPSIIVTGFDRPNLSLSVEATTRGQAKLDATVGAIRRHTAEGGAAIVYAGTRKRTEELADQLGELGFDAHPYHAGMSSAARAIVERRFADAEQPVVVATTAFGMGIDRADVRVVVHYQIPSAPESYYQEVGRAGRDGAPAAGVLLYDQGDLRFAHLRIESSCPTPEAVESAFQLVASSHQPEAGLEAWVERLEAEVGPSARACLVALEHAGDITLPGGAQRERASVDRGLLAERGRRERARLEAMIGYVSRAACRRRYLVDYFGDDRRPDQCGMCDRCLGPGPSELGGEQLQSALMALSCIARMRGRYGKGRVADVLRGADAASVHESGLNRLSTFGLLSSWPRTRILAMLDGLVRGDYARVLGAEYPKLVLTERGAEALKSRGPIALELPPAPPSKGRKDAVAMRPEDEALFEALRAWRTDLAKTLGQPPYVVAHDRTLAAVCHTRPRTSHELSRVPGVGPAKLEKFGDDLLALVARHSS